MRANETGMIHLRGLCGCVFAAMLCACASTECQQKVDVAQFGDAQLSCEQLKAEAERMDGIIADAEAASSSASAKGTATSAGTQAAGALGGLSGIPGLSYIGSLLSEVAPSTCKQEAVEAKQAAEQRKQNMIAQFNQKNCAF